MKKYLTRWLPLLLAAVLVLSGCMAAPAPERNTPVTSDPEETTLSFTLIEEETAELPTEAPTEEITESLTEAPAEETIAEDGTYTSKEEVAAYLNLYGHLPDNFISKKDAKAKGWDGSGRTLWDYFPGMSIGGDYFGNYEEQLPKKKGRKYTECDINYNGRSRGTERIVFSNDGLIYYTGDHYETFVLLYGEE